MLVASPAASATLTTTFSDNNGFAGNMLDLNVLVTTGITLESLELNLDAGSWDLDLYSKSGAYAGSETNAGDWTLRSSVTGLTSAGAGLATAWDIADFVLSGDATSALYIVVTNGSGLNYTNGSAEGAVFASNADLEILEGIGTGAPFTSNFRPRVWNGTIEYSVNVPEPSSAILMGIGLIGLASVRRKPAARRLR